ncbi:MAG: hypothetical protein SH859_15775 [Hyphomicrobium aestuarii]|nr:hypothetical protein [Hyphomicrobium aestuarii]
MTFLLEKAVAVAQGLDPMAQDEIARMILSLAGRNDDVVVLTAEERSAIDRSREAADRGEFATDEDLRRVLTKYR